MFRHVSGVRTEAAATTAVIESEGLSFCADSQPRLILLQEEGVADSDPLRPKGSHSETKSSGQTSQGDTLAEKLARAPIASAIALESRCPSAQAFVRHGARLEVREEQDGRE